MFFSVIFLNGYCQVQSPNKYSPNLLEYYKQFGELNENNIAEGDEEKRVLRSKEIWMPRLYPHGDFSIAASAINDYASSYSFSMLDGEWKELGPVGIPGNESSNRGVGQIQCLEFHPNYNGMSNQIVFAGSNYGGLWKSVDAGESWEVWHTDFLPISSVSSIEISVQTPNTMFISTGRGISGMRNTFTPNASNANPTYTIGIYRSIDGGINWQAINDGLMDDYEEGGFIRRILANPNDANIMFAVGTQGVHRTMNALSVNPTWVKVFDAEPGTENDALIGLEFKPNDPNVIYVSGIEVYKSIDNGLNWQTISGTGTGLHIDDLPNDLSVSAINIGVTPDNPSIVIAYTQGKENGVGYGAAYIHRYNGSSWTQIHQWSAFNGFDAIYGRAALAVSPINEKEIYVGTTKLYGTRNYESSSFAYRSGYSITGFHADIQALEFFPNSPNQLLCGNDGGVSEKNLENLGLTGWSSRLEGLGVSTSWGFDVSDFDAHRIVVGNQDCGTYKFHPPSINYWSRIAGGDGYGAQFHQFNSDQVFFKLNGSFKKLNYVSNSITNEDLFLPNDPFVSTGSMIKSVSSFRANNHPRTGKFYLGFPEILERKIDSPVAGTQPLDVWQVRSNFGLGSNIADPSDNVAMWQRQMVEFKIAPSDPNYMYCSNISREGPGTASDYPLYFYRTTTGGCDGDFSYTCFDNISSNLPTGTTITDFVPVVTGIEVDPKNPEHIWVSISGYEPNIKVLESFDAGDNWVSTDPNNSLPNLPMNGIIHQQGSDGTLYLATDAGVYIRPSGQINWEKFGDIPNVRVTNLEINYCSEKLFVGTYGRGVWSIVLHEFNNKYDSYHIVEEDVTWDTNIGLAHNLKIPNGVTLTITGNLSMPTNARIEVESGGFLKVAGGTITNNCGKLWDGIYVEGDPNGQGVGSNPGKVSFTNDATISNARSAVNNFIKTDVSGIDWSTTGGRIFGHNANFTNNRRDAQFLVYQNVNINGNPIADYSKFIQCNFIVNDDFIEEESPIASVTNFRCNGIRFSGCTFKDDRSDVLPYNAREGIYVIKGTVKVNHFAQCVSCTGVPSTFMNLSKGINIQGNSGAFFNSQIQNSEFISCWRSVYLWGNANTEVVLNDFEVTPYPSAPGNDFPVGVYLHKKVRDYIVEDNNFYPVENSTAPLEGHSVGIVTNTGHDNNEKIYRNNFKHLSVGFESIGKNKLNSGLEYNGLRIKCNDFTDDRRDMYLVKGNDIYNQYGIAYNQGTAGTSYLAYNTFALNDTYINIDNELIPADIGSINYVYDSTQSDEEPTVNYIEVPGPLTNVFLNGTTPITASGCPSNYGIIGIQLGKGIKDQSIAGKVLKEAEMQQLLDGGDTEGLQTDVALTSNTEAWKKYMQLMSKSGYITEPVLEELTANENGFTKAMTRNVLVANPHSAKSQKVTEALDLRADPLPEYMREQIRLGLTQISTKEFLTMQRDMYKVQQDEVVNTMYHTLLKDSIPTDSMQTFIDILSNNNDMRFDYKLVELYDGSGQSYLGDALLTVMEGYDVSLAKLDELARYKSFRSLMKQWRINDINELDLSESEIQILEEYADIDDNAGAEAITILRANNATTVEEPVFINEDDKKLESMKPKPDMDLLNQDHGKLLLYPNPADEYFTVQYRIDKVFKEGVLRVIDVKGVVVYQQDLIYDKDHIIIEKSKGLKTGTYQCEISLDGNTYIVESIVLK